MIDLPESLGLNSQSYNIILVVVNRFIKMANFILIIKYVNTAFLARLMDRQIYLYYGMPKGIISDCNPLFINKFWSKLYNITEIKCKLLTVNK